MKKISLALILFLTACNQQPKEGADGYVFSEKQYEKQTVKVNIVTYKSRKELQSIAKTKGADYPDIVAFSILQPPYDTCTIHMIDPSVSYDPEFVGHEFLHCTYGQWHIDNDSR